MENPNNKKYNDNDKKEIKLKINKERVKKKSNPLSLINSQEFHEEKNNLRLSLPQSFPNNKNNSQKSFYCKKRKTAKKEIINLEYDIKKKKIIMKMILLIIKIKILRSNFLLSI